MAVIMKMVAGWQL